MPLGRRGRDANTGPMMVRERGNAAACPNLAWSWCGGKGESVGERGRKAQRWPGDGVVERGKCGGNAAARLTPASAALRVGCKPC